MKIMGFAMQGQCLSISPEQTHYLLSPNLLSFTLNTTLTLSIPDRLIIAAIGLCLHPQFSLRTLCHCTFFFNTKQYEWPFSPALMTRTPEADIFHIFSIDKYTDIYSAYTNTHGYGYYR